LLQQHAFSLQPQALALNLNILSHCGYPIAFELLQCRASLRLLVLSFPVDSFDLCDDAVLGIGDAVTTHASSQLGHIDRTFTSSAT